MNVATYLSAVDEYLDDLLAKDLPYFPLSFSPRDPLSRRAMSDITNPSLKKLAFLHSSLAIVGPPGAGKTRAVRDLAKVFCSSALRDPWSAGPIPLYIPLRYLPGSIDPSTSWADLLLAPLNHTLRNSACSFTNGNELALMLNERDFVMLIDGLNEISNDEALKVLNVLNTRPARTHIVLTSRIREYPTEYKEYAVYNIRTLSFPTEVRGFLRLASYKTNQTVSSRILRACEGDPALRQLATNPYMLSQLFLVARKSLPLPHDRTSLLELVAEELVQEQPLDEATVKAVLADIAGEMQFVRHALELSVGAAVSSSRSSVSDPSRLTNVLTQLIDVRLLVRSSNFSQNAPRELHKEDRIGFHHQVFQEFFAGVNLYEQVLRSGKPNVVRRAIKQYARSRWNWEAICTAVVLLARDQEQAAQQVRGWLVRTLPDLSAVIQSEIPESAASIGYNLEFNKQLIDRLRQRIILWALWVPHCYNWLPALLIGVVLFGILSVHHVVESIDMLGNALYPDKGWTAFVSMVFGLPIIYMLLLTAIYRKLDDLLFDRIVHPALDSLELLGFRGARETLRELRKRAMSNPFISQRMKEWIVSSPIVPLVDVHERHILRGMWDLPENRRDITPEWVATVLDRLDAPGIEETELVLVIDALRAALRILGSGEALYIEICDALQQYLKHAPRGRVRKHIATALQTAERPFVTRLVNHWKQKPALWVFAAGAVVFGCATYFRWPRMLGFLSAAMGIIGVLADVIGVVEDVHSPTED
jgi:hypothetical protein